MPRDAMAGPSFADYDDEESDHDEQDDEAFVEPRNGKRGGGKKENKSSSVRKAQNRQAQREFRQRRLAYVRDLEARVQLLASPHDDQVNTMRNALIALVEENKQLRKLCSQLSGFIGTAHTNVLAPAGMTREDLEAVLGRGDTDAMHASFAQSAERYDLPSLEQALESKPIMRGDQYDLHGGDGSSSPRSKRKRASDGTLSRPDDPSSRRQSGSNAPSSLPNRQTSTPVPSTMPSTMYPPLQAHHHQHYQPRPIDGGFYPYAPQGDLTQHYVSAMWPSADPTLYGHTVGGSDSQQLPLPIDEATTAFTTAAYAQHSNVGAKLSLPSGKARVTSQPSGQFDSQAPSTSQLLDEGIRLIGQHLSRGRQDPNYALPPTLMPTNLQLTVTHDSMIDGLVWPSMRDQVITARHRYNPHQLLEALTSNVELHGQSPEDALDPANWELKEPFIRAYSAIIDDGILDTTNYWRRQRNEPSIESSSLGERPGPVQLPPRSHSF